jgi:ankyrin repeat protein
MPYGNISLLGATLLHCAVEFGENACIDELLKRNANINARSEIIDGVGGQTPIFHAIATNAAANLHTLEFLAQRAGAAIDMSIQATFRLFDKPQPHPITPMEFAESSLGTSNPNRHIRGEVELALLRELASK